MGILRKIRDFEEIACSLQKSSSGMMPWLKGIETK
jgi:hypothetical protein